MLASLILLPGACVLALTGPGVRFEWPVSMISDLGARTCFMADGRWICSGRALPFDAALVLCGVLSCSAGLLLRTGSWPRSGVRPPPMPVPWFVVALLCAGIGLVVLGLFPSDSRHGVHMIGAVLALPGSAILLAISGLRGEIPGAAASAPLPRREEPAPPPAGGSRPGGDPRGRFRASRGRPRFRAGCALAALVGTLVHLAPHWRVQGAAEILALACLLMVLAVESWAILRSSSRGPA